MARQFREQLEEEVQLEQARKAQRTAAASPAEPPTPAASSPRGNGRAPLVTPDTTHRDPPSHATASEAALTDATATDATATDATAADATATRPAEAGGTDERRT
jgi:hypothetical protein